MNSYVDISKKYLKNNKGRTISIIISIIIPLILVFGIATIAISGYKGLLKYSKVDGDYQIVFDKVSSEEYNSLKNNVNIDKICAVKKEDALLENQKSDEIKIKMSSYLDTKQEVFNNSITDGAYPSNSQEIMLEERLTYYLDKEYKIGDKIKFNISNNGEVREKEYTISGLYQKEESLDKSLNYEILKVADDNTENEKFQAYVSLKDYSDIKASAKEMSEKYDINILGYNESQLTLLNQNIDAQANTIIIFTIIVFMVLISEMIIRNTFFMSVTERIKEFGILRSLGASYKQLKKIIYKEALILGGISIILGIGISFGGLKIIVNRINNAFDIGEYFKIDFYPCAVLASILLIAVSILWALFEPFKILKKISPLEAVRSNFTVKKEKIKRKNNFLIRKIFGVIGEYSYKNACRNKGKFSSLLIAFTISISLFVATNAVINTMISIIQVEYVPIDHYYDICAGTYYNLADKVDMNKCISEIKSIEDVEDANIYISKVDGIIGGEISRAEEYLKYVDDSNCDEKLSQVYLDQYNTKELEILKERVVEGDFDPETLSDDEIIIINYMNVNDEDGKTKQIKISNINVGDEIEVGDYKRLDEKLEQEGDKTEKSCGNYQKRIERIKKEGFTKKFKVVAIVDGNNLIGNGIVKAISQNDVPCIINEKGMDSIFKTKDPVGISIKLKNKDEFKNLMKYINTNPKFTRFDFYDQMGQAIEIQKEIKRYVNIFSIVVGLICLINILNTIASNQVLRKREFACLRVIGMSKKMQCKMIILEGITVSIMALVIGIISGNMIGAFIIKGMTASMVDDPIYYKIPYTSIALACIVVIIIVLIASIIPMRKIKNESIVKEIAEN